jgi:hypothetical protein
MDQMIILSQICCNVRVAPVKVRDKLISPPSPCTVTKLSFTDNYERDSTSLLSYFDHGLLQLYISGHSYDGK